MTRENVERAKRAFDPFRRGDLEVAFEFIDASFEVNDHVVPEASPTERGPDALIANVGQVREACGNITFEPREIVDGGDLVLVRVHISARGLHTALPIGDEVGHVYRLRGQSGPPRHLPYLGPGPRSRRAVGVGDVAVPRAS
jgi:ketosteroid isomerase-like protein